MQIDLTQIILAILGIIGAVISGYLIPMLKAKTIEMKQAGEEAKVAAIISAVDIGVYSAEQLMKNFNGEEKLAHAMEVAAAELEKRGMHIETDTLRNYIEAALMRLKIALQEAVHIQKPPEQTEGE